MIVAVYTLGRRLQNKMAKIHRQDWDVTSPRFGKYYLDIVGAFRSENGIHSFYCEDSTEEIEKWLIEHGYIRVDCDSCMHGYYKGDMLECSAGKECIPKYAN